MPRQFGPTQAARRARGRARGAPPAARRPRAPISAKPAEMTTSARTPASSASSAASSTFSPGTQMTREVDVARGSRRRGRSPCTPATESPLRLTGYDGAGEVGGEDVAEELAADRAAPLRRADDRDRARPEERLERGAHGGVVARGDLLAVARWSARSGTGPRPRRRSAARVTSKPASRKTPSIASFSCSTSATNSLDPGLGRRGRRAARAGASRSRAAG